MDPIVNFMTDGKDSRFAHNT